MEDCSTGNDQLSVASITQRPSNQVETFSVNWDAPGIVKINQAVQLNSYETSVDRSQTRLASYQEVRRPSTFKAAKSDTSDIIPVPEYTFVRKKDVTTIDLSLSDDEVDSRKTHSAADEAGELSGSEIEKLMSKYKKPKIMTDNTFNTDKSSNVIIVAKSTNLASSTFLGSNLSTEASNLQPRSQVKPVNTPKRKTATVQAQEMSSTLKPLPPRRSILSPGAYRELESDDESEGASSSRKRRRRGRRCSDDDRSFSAGIKVSTASPTSAVASRRLNIKQEPTDKPKIKLRGSINLCSDEEDDAPAADNQNVPSVQHTTVANETQSEMLIPQPLAVFPTMLNSSRRPPPAACDYVPAAAAAASTDGDDELEDEIEIIQEEAPIDLTNDSDDPGIGSVSGEDYLNSVIQELFPSGLGQNSE